MSTYECLMPNCQEVVYRRRDVCEPCWQDRTSQLAALPELYVMTYALLTPGSRIQEISTIHLSPPESQVPFSLVAYDSLEQAWGTLAGWASWLRSKTGDAFRQAFTTGERFIISVDYLRRHDRHLGLSDFAGDYVLDIWTVYRRLAVQCLPTEPRHLATPCPTCENATIVTRHADEYAACLTCATVWPHSALSIIGKRVA
jgi:ribosomal protein S27E